MTSTPSSRRSNGNIVASMAWSLHAIEQTQLRGKHRVDDARRPKFDFHTAPSFDQPYHRNLLYV